MAADLHIHILERPEQEQFVEAMEANCLGSKHFGKKTSISFEEAYREIGNTPNTWIGEVSWLKAALLGDGETFVPATVNLVNDLVGEDYPTIDDAFIGQIEAAFASKNTTGYSLAKVEDVVKFLNIYRGKRVFAVSW